MNHLVVEIMEANVAEHLAALKEYCNNDVELTEKVFRELKNLNKPPFVAFVQGFGQINEPIDTTRQPKKLPRKFTMEWIQRGISQGTYIMEIRLCGGYSPRTDKCSIHTIEHVMKQLEIGVWRIVE